MKKITIALILISLIFLTSCTNIVKEQQRSPEFKEKSEYCIQISCEKISSGTSCDLEKYKECLESENI